MRDPTAGCYLGVDVGTGSARAGLFDAAGAMLACASRPIQLWRPEPHFAEQSSDDIWSAVCAAVRDALTVAAVSPAHVRGVGFDATCSLVALDQQDRPVSLSPTTRDEQNVIVWMDHRAAAEADRITATGHDVLRYVGGRVSLEMQTPKLLWLKQRLPASWARAARFFDLPDFLTYRATGDETRSLCSTTCKWTYLAHHKSGWQGDFFRAIELGELVDEDYRRIGRTIRHMGSPIGDGLTAAAAAELGLRAGTPVGVSIIDAHAGGLGVLGAVLGHAAAPIDFERRIALIGGTSSCHMAVSREPRFIPGVWGPYFSAMVPGLWLTEGGQSATGALIDHVIDVHARGAALREEARQQNTTAYELLNRRLDAIAPDPRAQAELTRDLHVLPYFHGNRSPRADATLRGVISGLTLDDGFDALAALYLATIQAIAHGTRHIIDTLNAAGYRIDTILACGGGSKNPLFLREHADITGCRLATPAEPEAVLLGSAILGATAGGDFADIPSAMAAMSRVGRVIEPTGGPVARYHAAKHDVFHAMYGDFIAAHSCMALDRASARGSRQRQPHAALADLCDGLFADLGFVHSAELLSAEQLPAAARSLLVHREHMTAVLRKQFGEPLSLRVQSRSVVYDDYRRLIALDAGAPAKVVEIGVVRIDLSQMPAAVRDEILAADTPLGDILIRHNVMRRISPRWYFRFDASSPIGQALGGEAYGRVGTIYCDELPAIDLLEAVRA